MANCNVGGCERSDGLDYTCSYCDETHCQHHRLPEKHDCIWLTIVNALGPDFRQWDTDELSARLEDSEADVTSGLVDEAQRITETTEKKEVVACKQCGDYTIPENDRCLTCRRKAQAMTYSSPDVAVDGSIETSGAKARSTEDAESGEPPGVLGRLLAALGLR